MNVRDIMQTSPVIPVLVIEDLATAQPLAEALVAGGLRVLEITLRTPQALDAIRLMSEVPGAIVGVGTALNGEDLSRAADQGASFAVSPGFTPELAQAARALGLPLLPGVMTPSDIIRARDEGLDALKFFPASQAGGTAMLKGFGGPFIDTVFCPTGGINVNTASEYLALDNVLCVGGSWVAPSSLVKDGDWAAITELAQACQEL